MTADELHELLFADPAGKALADAGNDTGAALRASASAPPVIISLLATELTVLGAFANPADGEALLQTLETVATGNALVKRALRWLAPGGTGLDLGHPSTRVMLDGLQQAGALTAEQVGTVKALAQRQPTVTASDVARAWARYRSS